jgi:hypothetical protein
MNVPTDCSDVPPSGQPDCVTFSRRPQNAIELSIAT